jgi:uncharacterized membrane protein
MASITAYVSASANDWYAPPYDDTSTTMVAQQNNFLSPAVSQTAHCKIDTSSIPASATVQSITFHWYDHSYTTSSRTLQSRVIWINNSSDNATYYAFYNNTVTLSAGWKNTTTTNASALAKVNKGGYTFFRFSVGDPGTSKYRIWNIRTWDYSGDTTNACYVEVEYVLGGRRYHVQIF